MPQLLATLLHISDLHVGVPDAQTGDAVLSPLVSAAYQHCTWLDGLLGHHSQALEDLEEFLENELRSKNEDPHIVITGDLTRVGDAAELQLAQQYIDSAIVLGTPTVGRLTGLAANGSSTAIPGNHDHWGGTPPPSGGAGSTAYAQMALNLPDVVYPPVTLSNGRQLVFIRVDSDADVPARSLHRTLAIGEFLHHIQAALPLQAPAPEEVRVMLIHHSWAQSGVFLRMGTASKAALGRLLQQHGITVVLTGHAHGPWMAPILAGSGAGSGPVYELRCGTTTQYDVLPKTWLYRATQALPGFQQPPRPGNTLIVHRLRELDDGTWWHATVYGRGPKGHFKALSAPNAELMFKV